MTSSTLSGERRWASARRSGMTVLGKVPKPINLPSQRLENHGLDPTVEIVPKGSLSWGSRSSSSTSNAWGSSTLSPHTDSGTGSPSHLSGRPSSGRPSTAGSDRAHEPSANAWGSNSRPSSASGVLTSNQTSLASLRPHSAETRPGSSHLSRFAEPLSENSVAWGAAASAEKLGVTSSKNDGFSLTSRDFPTLGSEKDTSGKNTESQDHGSHARPGSSSGGVAAVKERTGTSVSGDVSVNANARSGTANSWRRDNHPYGEDGVRPSVEKWQADPQGPQRYPNTSMPPQHYDTWHGPPINNHPGGVWYRGPPGGPPYGPPGGFPMEPFPYYRPQIPATALANPQPIPQPGAGPRGHHPKSGDMYIPPMPDAYVRPGMPIRPGFYHGPVAYEGFYGPPMGYYNSNEREIPFMGMPAGPSAYNRYSDSNAPDPGNSHARSSGYGHTNMALASEQVESGHPHEMLGPYKVLLKQHDCWDGKDEQKWEDSVTNNASHVEKGDQQRLSSWENDRRADHEKDVEMDKRRKVVGVEASSQTSDHQVGGSSVIVKSKSPESVENLKACEDSSVKKVEHAVSAFPAVSAAPKDSSLIQKIEGLNAKVRASDGRHDSTSVSSREEQNIKLQVGNSKTNCSVNEPPNGAVAAAILSERSQATGILNPASQEGDSSVNRSLEFAAASGMTISRRSTHGIQGRADHRGKGRFNTQEIDGWRKKPPVADSSSVVSAANSENSSTVPVQDFSSMVAIEKSGSYSQGKDEGESVLPVFDPSDSQAQRAMMRELAKQRAKQRQKEEEERIRDQKAKALAKLEELNRRTKAAEEVTKKLEVSSGSDIQSKLDEHGTLSDPPLVAWKFEPSSSALVSDPDIVAQISESSTVEKSTALSNELHAKSAQKETLPLKQDANNADTAHGNNASHFLNGGASKQKRMGYTQKQNIPVEKNFTEKFSSPSITEAVNVVPSPEVVASEIASSCEPTLHVNANVMTDPSVHQRRKYNRSGKNKHRVEEAAPTTALASAVSKETNLTDTLVESEPKASESELDPGPVLSPAYSKDASRCSEQGSSLPNEETRRRANKQWKSQHSRRTARNPQANKSAEKFHSGDAVIWAPVGTHNKTEVSNEVSQKPVVEAVAPLMKSDIQVQNNPRNKRAEIERYVPNPVAKEMAQQGGSQQANAPSVNQTMSDETVGRVDGGSQSTEISLPAGSAIGKVGSASESGNGDGRQNKHGKGHGSWRQRVPAESTLMQGLQDGQSSNSSRNVQKECHVPQKHDLSSVREPPKYSDEWNASDSWKIPENSDSIAPQAVPVVVKDQGLTSRGKRQAFRGHKGTGNSHDDHKKNNNGDADKIYKQSSVSEMSQTDIPAASKENRGVGDRSTPHWQPKSQAPSASNQQGNRASSGQNVGVEAARPNKKDSAPRLSRPHQPDKDETNEGRVRHPHDQIISDKSIEEEAPNAAGHQEPRRERKMASLKGQPHSPNDGPGGPVEPALTSKVDIRLEQNSSSGFRKNGNQSSRYGRGHESRVEWGSSGQDNKQHSLPTNRDRQRQNSHYEYQPIGPHNNDKADNSERRKDGSHNSGPKFRERGPSHSRRGDFYGRQSGSVQADGGYD